MHMIAVEDIYSRVSNARGIASRIRGRAKELDRSVASVLKAVKLGPSFVKDLDQTPLASPRTENLRKLARELDVSFEWLATGSGAPSSGSAGAEPGRYGYDDRRSLPPRAQRSVRPSRADLERLLDQTGEPIVIDVPEYDVQLSAGHGALISDEAVRRYWGLPRSYLESLGLDVSRIAFVEIVGDSMAPALMPGDLVLLDLRSTNPALPAIYALWDGDATVCKRVEKVHGSDPPMVRIISENKAYTAYDVPAEWVNVIGRVAWFARRT